MELLAAEPPGLLGEPLEEQSSVAAPASFGQGREIVHVEITAPGEHVADPEAGDGDRMRHLVLEDPHESVALGALHLVDAVHECGLVREVGP